MPFALMAGWVWQIAAIQAAGEPILPQDFAIRDIDVPGNASPDIIAALALLQTDTENWKKLWQFTVALPLRPEETTAITVVLNDSSAAL